ncbi:MAG: hypothetical protein QF792_03600, partial [Phycisphaerae bacterium]|nr:hypothetical protein [Phycisphaerae bacterium]
GQSPNASSIFAKQSRFFNEYMQSPGCFPDFVKTGVQDSEGFEYHQVFPGTPRFGGGYPGDRTGRA